VRHGRATPTAVAAAIALTVSVAGCSSNPSAAPAAGSSHPTSGFVIDQDFPDPDLMRVGRDYYAYATNSAAANIQIATSRDLTHWSVSGTDALPVVPIWAAPGKTWAPDVSELSPGRYVMYFTAASAEPASQCIGVATATSPEGPFTSAGDSPLLCPTEEGDAIDPSTFLDTDGTRYLVWKNDGNSRGLDTWLQLSPLSPDGLALAGPTTKLIKQTAVWEGSLIEAPVLVHHDANYVLFYSASNYGDDSYAIGYAVAQSVTGPFVKNAEPLLSTASSGGRFTGPGGQDVIESPDGGGWLAFHSWDPAMVYRGMNMVPLTWRNNEPTVA